MIKKKVLDIEIHPCTFSGNSDNVSGLVCQIIAFQCTYIKINFRAKKGILIFLNLWGNGLICMIYTIGKFRDVESSLVVHLRESL